MAGSAAPVDFAREIQPLLAEFCLNCHSTEKKKGDLDLEVFSSLEAVRRHPKVWQLVGEQLANNEMPPKEKAQPTAEEKERLAKWVAATLDDLARARAGDPGPVVLRRLSNAEYTYTVRDLTGVESLDPAREFPVDGAAGEGFTNTGQALVMSPSLITKYLDAGKAIAGHAVLLPDGIRFSSKTTRRDWTDEIVREIQAFYGGFAEKRANEKMNVDGVMIETNDKGFLPVGKYLAAALASGSKSIDAAAREHGVNAKYLGTLVTALSSNEPSLLLDGLRARWRTAKPGEAGPLAAEIAQWQRALWKLNKVGHIGKIGGPKAWMEPVTPLTAKQEVRVKIPTPADGKEVTLFLAASDAGDGNESDFVVWEQPRLVAAGRPDLLLRDTREVTRDLARRRELIFASTAKCLHAAAESMETPGEIDVAELARKHGVVPEALSAWLDYLGIGSSGPVEIGSHLRTKILKTGNYDFIKGWNWGDDQPPGLAANPPISTFASPET